ncbi:YaaL family protein [Pseudalkalibacillus caeni]|uniref:DUF2508 family protein n=1 Tax=Exobacillus caeni TaxID=2574798 RepID=A0A5R9EWI9_9BACL|nr:YaaL family protein [Pseudalkalibacillus caeni]TLS35019.1 DUF2508 family protein [Pseudalkalibacillus caeni]
MLFKRKGYLRKEADERLMATLEDLKIQWMRQKEIVAKSMEPPDTVLYQLKLAEAKYFFLLKEAKERRVRAEGFS